MYRRCARRATAHGLYRIAEAASRGLAESHASGAITFAELLEGVVRQDSFEERGGEVSLIDLLMARGWSRFGSEITLGYHRVVVQQGPEAAPRQRLTAREFQVAARAALGQPSKRIGEELSIAAATARGATERCVRKLGLASSVQLPLLWRTLCSPCRSFSQQGDPATYLLFQTSLSALALHELTQVERLLVRHLLLGDRTRDIAAHRAVSARTVANQMAALFRKLGVSSRGELIARVVAAEGAAGQFQAGLRRS